MRRFWRIYRLIRQLQHYQAFKSLTITNEGIEIECSDGLIGMKGDIYMAMRVLKTLKENERRGLEWANKPYSSGRTAA